MRELITPEYRELNRQLHEQSPTYGVSGWKRAAMVDMLCEQTKPKTILDYGCGKGSLALHLSQKVHEYDPAVPGKDDRPEPADLVVCTDVLEHVEPDCIDAVLADLARVTKKYGYLLVHTGAASKVLRDGRNAHLIQEGQDWWEDKIKQHFNLARTIVDGLELHIFVSAK